MGKHNNRPVAIARLMSTFPKAASPRPFRGRGIIPHTGTVKLPGIEEIRFVAEPDDPAENTAVEWYSDGTGFGDAGDKITKINVAGTIKTFTFPDFSETPDEDP